MNVKKSKYFRLNKIKRKKNLVVTVFIISFLIIPIFDKININQYDNDIKKDFRKNDELLNDNLKTQDISTDNTFNGIGAPWNVTHYANHTKSNLEMSFNNNSFNDDYQIELDDGWMGYQYNTTIKNLYISNNWINGTFHNGTDDSDSGLTDIDNVVNWTFDFENNNSNSGHINRFSGNYYDHENATNNFQDCLELRISKQSGADWYDQGDICRWNTSFTLPDTEIEDAWINLAIFPRYWDGYANHFEIRIKINDQVVWNAALLSLKNLYGPQWHTIQPQILDPTNSAIFPGGITDMNVSIEFERIGESTQYSSYAESYGVLVDNVSLVLKTKANPTEINLEFNNKQINDNVVNDGEGYVGILGAWNGTKLDAVTAKFSSDYNWSLVFNDNGIVKSYKIEFDANLTLYINKTTPESYYMADPTDIYQGSTFAVANNSNVNWTTYAHMEIPSGYEETNMTLEFPSDYNLSRAYYSQDSVSLDKINITDFGNKKVANIPVSSITSNTNLFWKLEAESPNYCTEMGIYKNTTIALDDWESSSTFLSGDYINITAKIKNSQLISGYIQQTNATLRIRFPDGTIWASETQFKSVNDTGWVYFDPILIPSSPPYYEAGVYEAIVTWNNSYSSFDLNETGIIYKNFTVIHDSLLYPDQGIYFIENVIDDRIYNIKVSFTDIINGIAIDYATVTTNFTGTQENLDRISPGYYLYEFNASKVPEAGNNTVTIFANHSYYLNKTVNIIVDVVSETLLTVENNFFSVPWKNNFVVRFNFTKKNSGEGINATSNISISWLGNYVLYQPDTGQYELQCGTSAYASETIPSFIITINKYKYETQSVVIRVYITELATSLNLSLNGKEIGNNDKVTFTPYDLINMTVRFKDSLTDTPLSNANVSLLGTGDFDEAINYYNYSINASDLGYGITKFSISADVLNYQPQSIDFWIEVSRIVGTISRADGGDQIEVDVGEDVSLNIALRDPSNNTIKNANVTFTWAYGQGELKDQDNDGIYNDIIPNVRQGVHEIRINALFGDDYTFNEYKITLVVTSPVVTPGPDLSWLIYVLIGGIVGLVLFFTLYQIYFKYPPMVRKIRKLKKNVRKAKTTKPIIVNKRDDIINNELQNQIKSVEYEMIQFEEVDKVEKVIKKKGGVD